MTRLTTANPTTSPQLTLTERALAAWRQEQATELQQQTRELFAVIGPLLGRLPDPDDVEVLALPHDVLPDKHAMLVPVYHTGEGFALRLRSDRTLLAGRFDPVHGWRWARVGLNPTLAQLGRALLELFPDHPILEEVLR